MTLLLGEKLNIVSEMCLCFYHANAVSHRSLRGFSGAQLCLDPPVPDSAADYSHYQKGRVLPKASGWSFWWKASLFFPV
ncbi:MAG: hypothetical protein R2941_22375 [Desulfobacterales bacterium]